MSRYSTVWQPTGNKLQDHMNFHGVDEVRKLMKELDLPKPRPTRKDEMIKAISVHLQGRNLELMWNKLGHLDQLAVSEALHDKHRQFKEERFVARYGTPPSRLTLSSSTKPVLLQYFLYPADKYSQAAPIIPEDLAERLREIVPPPPETMLQLVEQLPNSVNRKKRWYQGKEGESEFFTVELVSRDMERAAQRDLLAVLRLVQHDRVAVSAKTRLPSAVAVQRIADVLVGGDFFEPNGRNKAGQKIGAMRAFAWPLLLQAGKLVQINGSKLALKKAGRNALQTPPEETLQSLWENWTYSNLIDEFNRVDAIRGQKSGRGRRVLTDAWERREVLADALAECPVGVWVHSAEFSRYMRAESYEFEVARDLSRLYIGEVEYGCLGYAGYHDWHILQDRYLLCVLFEYAATLGIIDVAYTHPDSARDDYHDQYGTENLSFLSRYDGLEYIRLTPLGAYCLGLSESYETQQPPDRTPLRIYPDLRVCCEQPLTADEQLTLENWAHDEADCVWRLDLGKSLAAIESGQSVDSLRTFLEARDDQSLPEKVEGFLKKAEQGGSALKERGRALLVECATDEIACKLAVDKRVSKMCQPAGGKLLAVQEKSEANFRKAVRELGYGMTQ